MIIIISPSKTLDLNEKVNIAEYTIPDFLDNSKEIIENLRSLSVEEISSSMDVSNKIAELNFQRYLKWSLPFTLVNSKQALFIYKGNVFKGINVESYKEDDYKFAQKHLRILSALYGVLRPLDLIQPYRLDMNNKLIDFKEKNLYKYWSEIVTEALNENLEEKQDNILINLASNEYFKIIDTKKFNGEIITPVFKEFKNGKYKVISSYAKHARGLMTSYIIKNQISNAQDIKLFNEEGYNFTEELSTDKEWVFTRSS